MVTRTVAGLTLSLALTLPLAEAAYAAAPSDEVAQKVVKTLITAIRYEKDDLAAKQLDFDNMAKLMMGDAWAKASAAQQKEIVSGLSTLIRKISFIRGREMFEHLDAVLYDKVRMEDGHAIVKATVVVHKAVKKTEVVIEFVLAESKGAWRIVDTILLGQSTAEGIREDQIEPLMEEGGMNAIMKALRDKVAEVS